MDPPFSRTSVPIVIPRAGIRVGFTRTVTGPWSRTSTVAIPTGIRRVRAIAVDCACRKEGGDRGRGLVWDRVDNI